MLKSTAKHLFVKKNLFLFVVIVVLCGVTIYNIRQRDMLYTDNELFTVHNMIHSEAVNDIEEVNGSCHYLEEGDVLPSAEDLKYFPKPNSIFFHETSCRGGLTSRQACAVESAARAHPMKEIHVLFSAPVSELIYRRSSIAKLRLFPNIRIARVHLTEYAKRTPLEHFVTSKPFYDSEWWVEHTSDVLRVLSLYRHGGICLDTDMIVVRSLTPLGHNWVGREDNHIVVNTAAIAVSMDDLGRRIARDLVNEIMTGYKADERNNGPSAITRVVAKLCTTTNVTEWSSSTCDGLAVYGPEYFYPVHYSSYDDYFQPADIEELTKTAYIHHFWNHLSYNMTIQRDSPYMKLAEKFCPTIFKMYGDNFGT